MAYFNGKKDFVLVSTKDDTDIINLKKRISVAETAEEMSTILSGATNDSVGSYYQYIGATNETYKKGATYRLAKDGSNQIVFEEIFEQGSSNVQVDTSLTKYGWAADAGIVGAKFNTKVNNTDIVNNLGTNDASKPLSAAQGVELSIRINTVGNNLHATQQDLATLTQRVDNLPSGGSDIQLDTTLTQSGKAADAKAVGDKFKDYATKTYVDSAVANSGGGGGSASLTPWFLNNSATCEEFTVALEDFIANGTPIIYNHEGDNCTLVSYEDSLSACYFVVPNGKKLLKIDLSSGMEFVVTEMDFCNLDGNHGGGGGSGTGTYSIGLAYTLKDNDEYEVSGIGTCTDTHIVIPSVVNSKKVTSIGKEAFNHKNILGVTIPEGIVTIEEFAFNDCEKLERVELPNTVTSIGKQAFCYCYQLASVTIPKSVTTIAKHAFLYSYRNNLTFYCEAESKPSGWEDDWDYVDGNPFTVVWGAALDFASVNNKLASAGGGGNILDGTSIKGIYFTNRADAWEWLKNNYTAVIKAVLTASLVPIPIIYSSANAQYSSSGNVTDVYLTTIYPSAIGTAEVLYSHLFFAINDHETTVLTNSHRASIGETAVAVTDEPPMTLPDSYWSMVNARLLILYIG